MFSVKGEVLYYILTVCDIPLKLVRIIKICLNKTYKNLSDAFPVQNGLKQGDAF
jgi:hypothetical protein